MMLDCGQAAIQAKHLIRLDLKIYTEKSEIISQVYFILFTLSGLNSEL